MGVSARPNHPWRAWYCRSRSPMSGFFACPPEKVYYRPRSVTADCADGVLPRLLTRAVDCTSRLCPAELNSHVSCQRYGVVRVLARLLRKYTLSGARENNQGRMKSYAPC